MKTLHKIQLQHNYLNVFQIIWAIRPKETKIINTILILFIPQPYVLHLQWKVFSQLFAQKEGLKKKKKRMIGFKTIREKKKVHLQLVNNV